jgi:hypothetical protein
MHHFPRLQDGGAISLDSLIAPSLPGPATGSSLKRLGVFWNISSLDAVSTKGYEGMQIIPDHTRLEELTLDLHVSLVACPAMLPLLAPSLKRLSLLLHYCEYGEDVVPDLNFPTLTYVFFVQSKRNKEFTLISTILRGAPRMERLSMATAYVDVTEGVFGAILGLEHLRTLKIIDGAVPADFFTKACGAWPKLEVCMLRLGYKIPVDDEASLLVPFLQTHPHLKSLEIRLQNIALPTDPDVVVELQRA